MSKEAPGEGPLPSNELGQFRQQGPNEEPELHPPRRPRSLAAWSKLRQEVSPADVRSLGHLLYIIGFRVAHFEIRHKLRLDLVPDLSPRLGYEHVDSLPGVLLVERLAERARLEVNMTKQWCDLASKEVATMYLTYPRKGLKQPMSSYRRSVIASTMDISKRGLEAPIGGHVELAHSLSGLKVPLLPDRSEDVFFYDLNGYYPYREEESL